jgi:hypothetical protein
LDCGHPAFAARRRACRHLVSEEPPEHYRLLSGVMMNYDLLCGSCVEGADPESALIRICEGCLDRLEGPFEVLGWRGNPQIVIADQEPQGRWTTRAWSAVAVNDRCLAALADGWLAHTAQGLQAMDSDGRARSLASVGVRAEQRPDQQWMGHVRGPALHTSADGRFAGSSRLIGIEASSVSAGGGAA